MMAEVLPPSHPREGQPYSSNPSGSLLHSSPSKTSLATLPFSQQSRLPSPAIAPVTGNASDIITDDEDDDSSYSRSSIDSEESSSCSPTYTPHHSSSLRSTPPSTLSLDTTKGDSLEKDDDENLFPSYDPPTYLAPPSHSVPPASPDTDQFSESTTSSSPPDEPTSPEVPHVADDSEAREEPTRQVDYLSHEWREEDIWSSWKHIVSKRSVYGERSRLENASWRTWAKQKNHLKTVPPERLNWLKDCDVTWLYGPLQQRFPNQKHNSESTGSSRLSKNGSFINKKPILKKRSASEIMLQKSISTSSLVKQAAAAVQAQRKTFPDRPTYSRVRSEYSSNTSSNTADFSGAFPSSSTSGVHSPEAGNKRHIRFDNKVEQCIAVEFKEGLQEEEEPQWNAIQDDTSSEDDLPMMKPTVRRHSSTVSSSRNSFSNSDQKGIAMLPSTTLKFDNGRDTSNPPPSPFGVSKRPTNTLQSSASQETIRPVNPATNFLIDDDLDEDNWRPSGTYASRMRGDSAPVASHTMPRIRLEAQDGDDDDEASGMRRTNSGMFMPYDEEEEENIMNSGLFGRMVDTVNTARDIAHVIWNVGWRK